MDSRSSPSDKSDEVITRVFVGDIRASVDYEALRTNMISHVLNVTNFPLDTVTMANYEKLNIRFAQVMMEDSPYFDLRKNIFAAVSTVRSALDDDGRILVHCTAGISRSATVVAAYMIEHLEYSAESALRRLKSKRPGVFPNSGFVAFLRKLESEKQPAGVLSKP